MNFLSLLFKSSPGAAFSYYPHVIGLALALIVWSIVFHYIYKSKKKTDIAFKKLFKDVSQKSALMGVLFLVLVAVRYENIPYFAMRLWLYLAVALLAYFIYKYAQTYKKDYKEMKSHIHEKQAHTTKPEKQYLASKKR